MNGEIAYKYVGNGKTPLVETQINQYVFDASDFVHAFNPKEKKLSNGIAKRINANRTNEEILYDLLATGEELLLRIDSTKIVNKTLYKQKIIDIMQFVHGKI
jgi:hypothetical protein